MKILFLSDIHGIIDNLGKIDTVIQKEKIERLVVLGDLYYTGFNSVDKKVDVFGVRDFLCKYKDILTVMRGNCDSSVDIENSPFPILEDISLIHVDDIDIYITHGNRYRYLKNDIFDHGVMIYGHEHIPYIRKELDMIYINTGSVSLPRNELGPSYTIYENRIFTIYSLLDDKIIDSISF